MAGGDWVTVYMAVVLDSSQSLTARMEVLFARVVVPVQGKFRSVLQNWQKKKSFFTKLLKHIFHEIYHL